MPGRKVRYFSEDEHNQRRDGRHGDQHRQPAAAGSRQNEWRARADYAYTNDCPSMLAVGASCAFTITFRQCYRMAGRLTVG